MENRVSIARFLKELTDLREHCEISRARAESPLEAHRLCHVFDHTDKTNNVLILIGKWPRANVDDDLTAMSRCAHLMITRYRLTAFKYPTNIVTNPKLPYLLEIKEASQANLLGIRDFEDSCHMRIHKLNYALGISGENTNWRRAKHLIAPVTLRCKCCLHLHTERNITPHKHDVLDEPRRSPHWIRGNIGPPRIGLMH